MHKFGALSGSGRNWLR